ncbi:MAG: hypothetical protein CVV27_08470 [Candidatus Melainabacteria bacterium HGW-Melainabacteria-1]|nr:MAG: hypothetical protein CVV27_08470 [Candidatus Melainabacteria bacterium HGW-Melainabacteria-1]
MARKVKTPPKTKQPELWAQVDRPQLLNLVKAYYSGALKKSDQTVVSGRVEVDGLLLKHDSHDKAVPMPHLAAQGKNLMADITYDDMSRVVRHVRSISVNVRGLTVHGWHEYVLRVLLKLTQPHHQENELMPKVHDGHYNEALEVWGRAFLRLILNQQ